MNTRSKRMNGSDSWNQSIFELLSSESMPAVRGFFLRNSRVVFPLAVTSSYLHCDQVPDLRGSAARGACCGLEAREELAEVREGRQDSAQNEGREELVVPLADAVAHQRTVVVQHLHAAVARLAVRRSLRPENLAAAAVDFPDVHGRGEPLDQRIRTFWSNEEFRFESVSRLSSSLLSATKLSGGSIKAHSTRDLFVRPVKM